MYKVKKKKSVGKMTLKLVFKPTKKIFSSMLNETEPTAEVME